MPFLIFLLFPILVYKIGSRSEFPVSSNVIPENNFTTSLKNYNDPTENDDPNFVTDSTTILLSGVSNLALNGNIFILKIYELCQLQFQHKIRIFVDRLKIILERT